MEPALTSARLAAQFSRSTGHAATVEEIARDALQFARIARRARKALEAQRCPENHFRDLEPLAERYSATVVKSADPAGMVVGLRFNNSTVTTGFRNIFFVS